MFWFKKKSKNNKVSLIVTCMDREDHLLISLKSWLDLDIIDDMVIVDWCSKNKLYNNLKFKKILKNNKILLLEVENEKYFSLARALNLAVDFTKNEMVLKIDADYICLDSSWIEDLKIKNRLEKFGNDYFIHGAWQFNKELSGLCFFNKSNFSFYREELENWGWEEIDMYKRMILKNKNIIEILFFNIEKYISHIPHKNNIRTKNYEMKNLEESNKRNAKICKEKLNLKRQKYRVVSISSNYKKINYNNEFYAI